MFALVDANAFYCSCERVFDARLRGRPFVVLSNNDGCAIARSDEAKALGVRMGQPAHELKDVVQRHGLLFRSANFGLYGDLSHRVVSVLRDFGVKVEVYSIDESFLDLTAVRDRLALGQDVRSTVLRWTGIPTCVGIGPTKTLAKLANKVAKKGRHVVDLSDLPARDGALATFPVEDVWGVGRKWAARLGDRGITTAAHLRDAPGQELLDAFGVVLHRTQRELQGHPCLSLEDIEPDRQQILVSRSFGARVEDHEAVAQAAATFAVRACEKLRKRGLVASGLTVFASTDAFRPELKQHHPSKTVTFPSATADTRVVLTAVSYLMGKMLRSGHGYKRAGVALLDLARPEALHGDLFSAPTMGNPLLMSALDGINRKFGRNSIGFAASGWKEKPEWGMRQNSLSPSYTTRWADLPMARC